MMCYIIKTAILFRLIPFVHKQYIITISYVLTAFSWKNIALEQAHRLLNTAWKSSMLRNGEDTLKNFVGLRIEVQP